MKRIPDFLGATDFQKRVWLAAAEIPEGQVRTYGWIARKIGYPKACRAVGSALKANPFPFMIPCHRVINKNGGIGGFAGGKQLKRTLLDLEGNIRTLTGILLIAIIVTLFVIPCKAKSVWNGNKGRNVVALTFDDGPKPEFCQPILEILDRYGAKATFFVVGKEAQDNPDLIMRIADSGNEVANHTYSHVSVKGLSSGQALGDIQRCSQVIYDIIGQQPKYFRPPGGSSNDRLSPGLKKMGLKTVYWTLNAGDYIETTPGYEVPEDFQAMAVDLAKRLVDKVTPGTIILLHNGSEQTVRALPFVLIDLKKKGYNFVTLSDIMEEKI